LALEPASLGLDNGVVLTVGGSEFSPLASVG
jgi:hypothetical protein